VSLYTADLLVCAFLEPTSEETTNEAVNNISEEQLSFRRSVGVPEELLQAGLPHPELGVLGCRLLEAHAEHIIVIHESFQMSHRRGVRSDSSAGKHFEVEQVVGENAV